MADVTRRVAAESSFALAKGNVKGNGILGTPVNLMVRQAGGFALGTRCDTPRRERTTMRQPNIQVPNGRFIRAPSNNTL